MKQLLDVAECDPKNLDEWLLKSILNIPADLAIFSNSRKMDRIHYTATIV